MGKNIVLMVLLFFQVGCYLETSMSKLNAEKTDSFTLSACTEDQILTNDCTAIASKIVTSTMGSQISSWTNSGASSTVTGAIPTGFYSSQMCTFSDDNLIASNIKLGVSIFGVSGGLVGKFADCADDALNAPQCSTAANRYVYATQYGGRNTNCSLGANASACWTNATNRYVSSTLGSSITGSDGSLSATIASGYYDGTTTASMTDSDLLAANIKSGSNIFGVAGSFTGNYQLNMASSALRDAGVQVIPNLTGQTTSNQITLDSEQNTYAGGADLPTTGGYNYRDVPDVNKDDEGYDGTTCKYASRPANDCGTTQNTIAGRIADCVTQNPTSSTWNGATQCSRGQGAWKLVTRNGANKEVWQDQRTGQIWSSTVTSAINWCQASGNIQLAPVTYSNSYNTAAGTPIIGNGTIGAISGGSSSAAETITITFTSATTFTVSSANCGGGTITSGGLTASAGSTATFSRANYCSFTLTQGAANFANNDIFIVKSVSAASYSCAPGAASALQPASPISYCAEVAGVNAPAGENWGTGVYMAAKGGMGKTATAQSPSVRWRLPSIEDYNIANANGIRMVMPDMGIAGTSRPIADGSTGGINYEWSSSLYSNSRNNAWYFNASRGLVSDVNRYFGYPVRCLAR